MEPRSCQDCIHREVCTHEEEILKDDTGMTETTTNVCSKNSDKVYNQILAMIQDSLRSVLGRYCQYFKRAVKEK